MGSQIDPRCVQNDFRKKLKTSCKKHAKSMPFGLLILRGRWHGDYYSGGTTKSPFVIKTEVSLQRGCVFTN